MDRAKELCDSQGVELIIINQSEIHTSLSNLIHKEMKYEGNKDENDFLGYFCKYGDGAVDIQLISGLHKSEVCAVGKYLNIPESILSAKPSKNLCNGQTDEEELGFGYDLIELITGVFLELDDEKQNEFVNELSPDSSSYLSEHINKCLKIHFMNKHKLIGVINL